MTKKEQADKARFEEMVRTLSQDVYRYAFWLCKNSHMAEELAQETFMRAWKSFDSLKDMGAAKSWLFTIVRRENARQYERKQLDMQDDVDFGMVEGRKGYDTSTEAFVLRRALAELPEEYREPLVLQVIGGFSSEEIAQHLDLTSGAVMTRLFRARKKMREMLQGEDEANPATSGT